MGTVKTGVILKDVSLEVHGGEVLAILGSKGETIFFPQITGIEVRYCFVRFEIFTAVTMKNAILWDIKTQFVLHRRHITSLLQSPAG
jgi:Fe-S cluster assembly ATPase SufC